MFYIIYYFEYLLPIFISVELEQMLSDDGVQFTDLSPVEYSHPFDPLQPENEKHKSLFAHEGSGSGGYCQHVFKHAAKELFGDEDVKSEYKMLRYDYILFLFDNNKDGQDKKNDFS